MSIALEIDRIRVARNESRTKLNAMGLVEPSANIEDVAAAIKAMPNMGAVQAKVQEGETYTIPQGYHNGAGTVAGVKGGGNYSLQDKEATPTKKLQTITSDPGYYGLGSVTVNPIPNNYQDTSAVTASAGDVLANKIIVNKEGKNIAGTMPNNGAVKATLSIETPSYTVPVGYHSGLGVVSILPEEKTLAPTRLEQIVTPSEGKVLSKVTVSAIPENLIDTTDADATVGQVLLGATAYVNGVKITGTMPNNGVTSLTIDGLTHTNVSIPAGYTTGGTVSLTGDIEAALAEI